MPKVISYTPSWLSRPNPGFQLFSSTQATLSNPYTDGKSPRHLANGHTEAAKTAQEGPRRVIARRGTEIFVVADNQIRWSDLCMLKDDWAERENRKRERKKAKKDSQGNLQGGAEGEDGTAGSYRVRITFPAQFSIANVLAGSRSQLQRENQTAFNIAEWEISCYHNVSYHPCRSSSRLLPAWPER